MANEEHLAILRQGTKTWNEWTTETNSTRRADLSKAELRGADLREANLMAADLTEANLMGANLSEARLTGARLTGTRLIGARLSRADLTRANLRGANLSEANLGGVKLRQANMSSANLSGASLSRADLGEANLLYANLRGADLSGAILERASLIDTILENADLKGCRIFGISAWSLTLKGAQQHDLIITRDGEREVTADDIEIAQFIYLLLHNEKIRGVIDTITSKVVLILGRFTSERKRVLDALRDELRKRNYLPVVFDFEKPASQTIDETITLLARMARFVIADVSDAKSVLQELRGIVPDLPSVAVQPLLLRPQEEPGMFDFFRRYPWVLRVHRYDTLDQLIAELGERVIGPAEAKVVELRSVGPVGTT